MLFWDYLALGCLLLIVISIGLASIVGLIYWCIKRVVLKLKKESLLN